MLRAPAPLDHTQRSASRGRTPSTHVESPSVMTVVAITAAEVSAVS
jgi:hypothetical protein